MASTEEFEKEMDMISVYVWGCKWGGISIPWYLLDSRELSTPELFLGYPKSRAQDKGPSVRGLGEWAGTGGRIPLRGIAGLPLGSGGLIAPGRPAAYRMAPELSPWSVMQAALTLLCLRRPGALPKLKGPWDSKQRPMASPWGVLSSPGHPVCPISRVILLHPHVPLSDVCIFCIFKILDILKIWYIVSCLEDMSLCF